MFRSTPAWSGRRDRVVRRQPGGFDPRPRGAGDGSAAERRPEMFRSTPAWSGRPGCGLRRPPEFRSTPAWSGRRRRAQESPLLFRSTPAWSGRPARRRCVANADVSIHARVERATGVRARPGRWFRSTPAWSGRQPRRGPAGRHQFRSTPAWSGRPARAPPSLRVSIHARVERATGAPWSCRGGRVSIHARVERATGALEGRMEHGVSIHARVERATRVRDTLAGVTCFDPRPRGAGDHRGGRVAAGAFRSTPAWSGRRPGGNRVGGFDPRPRGAGDPSPSRTTPRVSIHARVERATRDREPQQAAGRFRSTPAWSGRR